MNEARVFTPKVYTVEDEQQNRPDISSSKEMVRGLSCTLHRRKMHWVAGSCHFIKSTKILL